MTALLWLAIAAILVGCMVACADAPADPLAQFGEDPHDWSDR